MIERAGGVLDDVGVSDDGRREVRYWIT